MQWDQAKGYAFLDSATGRLKFSSGVILSKIPFGGDTHSLAYSKSGKLAFITQEGDLLEYDPSFLVAKKARLADSLSWIRPSSICYSPDEKQILIGTLDQDPAAVVIVNASSLAVHHVIYSDLQGDHFLTMSAVYSGDSDHIITLSTRGDVTCYQRSQRNEWKQSNRSSFTLPIGVSDAVWTKKGIFYGGWKGLGFLELSQTKDIIASESRTVKNPTISFVNNEQAYGVSQDGDLIRFPTAGGTIYLSITKGLLGSSSEQLIQSISSSDALKVSLTNTFHPTINGYAIEKVPLKERLSQYSCSAISPDKIHVAFGTTFGVVLCDNKGKKIWDKSSAVSVTQTLFSPDGHFVYVFQNDGLIVVRDAESGAEFLTICIFVR